MVSSNLVIFRQRRGLCQHQLVAALDPPRPRHAIIRLEAGVGSERLLAAMKAVLEVKVANVGASILTGMFASALLPIGRGFG